MNSEAFRIDDFLPYLLAQAADDASARFSKVYRSRYGMLRTDWRALFHLGTAGELAARDNVARTGEDKTQVSRAVARLETRGWLSRRRDPTDRRTERLKLTEAGRAVFDDLRIEAESYDATLAERIGAAEMAQLKRILGRLAKGRQTPAN